jgi:hypothetical protein
MLLSVPKLYPRVAGLAQTSGHIVKTYLAVVMGAMSLVVFPSLSRAADEAPAPAPQLKVGDAWVLDHTTQVGQKFTRERLDVSVDSVRSDAMMLGLKLDGAPSAPQEVIQGLDWSIRLLVDDKQTTTARPLRFPLRVGDSWTADWTDPRHVGMQLSAHFHRTYKVIGWEDVTVPAGVFHAVKIEENGVGDAQMQVPSVATSAAIGAPGSSTAVSHAQVGGRGVLHQTTYSELYYSPDAKRLVKTVEELYSASNVMSKRDTWEMVSFKPGA